MAGVVVEDFPTRVGVNRGWYVKYIIHYRFPHTCGGEPPTPAPMTINIVISPHVWG